MCLPVVVSNVSTLKSFEKWEDNFVGALIRAVVKRAQESLNHKTCPLF